MDLETVERDRSERQARKENTKKKTTVTIANLTTDDRRTTNRGWRVAPLRNTVRC